MTNPPRISTPNTPTTLLRKLTDGDVDQLNWRNLINHYAPVIRRWLCLRGIPQNELDEVAQDVYIKLARLLQNRQYHVDRAKFRTYLSHIVQSVALDALRAKLARNKKADLRSDVDLDSLNAQLPDIGEQLDVQYTLVRYQAALDQVQRDPGLLEIQRVVFSQCIIQEIAPQVIATQYNIKVNTINQIKRRLLERVRRIAKAGMR